MKKVRRQLWTLVKEGHTLTEILDQLEYDRYFRDLMRVLSEDSLAHLLRDDESILQLTDYTRAKLAEWHRPEWMCSQSEQPEIVRCCIRLEQLHRREGLEVHYPSFPFDRRSNFRVRAAFAKKWRHLSGFHLLRLFGNTGHITNPLTDEQLRWVERCSFVEFRLWLRGPHIVPELVN